MTTEPPKFPTNLCKSCGYPFDNHSFDFKGGGITCPSKGKRIVYRDREEELPPKPDDPLGPMPV